MKKAENKNVRPKLNSLVKIARQCPKDIRGDKVSYCQIFFCVRFADFFMFVGRLTGTVIKINWTCCLL